MIEKMITHEGDSYHPTRSKINEIIDKLNNESLMISEICIGVDDIGERVTTLEQCPVNDVRLCNPYHKPDYDTDLVSRRGTFEWALIQMKNGKSIKRKDSEHIYLLKDDMICATHMALSGVFKVSAILATDWEIYEIQT